MTCVVRTSAIVAVIALLGHGTAGAQSMTDGSSTYIDTWEQGGGIVGYGATDGTIAVHQYVVSVRITSPAGRQASASTSSYPYGSVISVDAVLPWDTSDLGDYRIETDHTFYCDGSGGGMPFLLASLNRIVGLSIRISFFTNPINVGIDGCYYDQLACSSGTPTCTAGWTLGLGRPCPLYARAAFLVINFGSYHTCSIGVSAAAPGPGPCN
jgi:hypothetical protein